MLNDLTLNFENEGEWKTIAEDVIKHIPAIPSGEQKWLKICTQMKNAGYTLEEVQAWGQAPTQTK